MRGRRQNGGSTAGRRRERRGIHDPARQLLARKREQLAARSQRIDRFPRIADFEAMFRRQQSSGEYPTDEEIRKQLRQLEPET
jgi:hypothetical protein